MGRINTLTAFAGAALLSTAAFAAQGFNAAAQYEDGELRLDLAIDDPAQPERDALGLDAYYDDDHTLDFGAGAVQAAGRLKLSLAFPADEATGAEFLYIDVLEPGTGFLIYEIAVRIADLQVFLADLDQNFGDAGHKPGQDPGQDVPIGNPYGDDVLHPQAQKLQTLYPVDPAFDFGDGGVAAATTATIPVRRPSLAGGPAGSLDDFDPGNPGYDPPIGNPYGDDAITIDWGLQDFNSYSDPALDFGDGSGSTGPGFAPGDGDLGGNDTNEDDFTLVSGPSPKSAIPFNEPSLAVNTDNLAPQTPVANNPEPTDQALDCNNNGTADHLEIAGDPGLDLDGDGRIDRCTASGDLNADGSVDVMDLIALMTSWGTCVLDAGCQGDLTADGMINEDDIAVLFNHWTY